MSFENQEEIHLDEELEHIQPGHMLLKHALKKIIEQDQYLWDRLRSADIRITRQGNRILELMEQVEELATELAEERTLTQQLQLQVANHERTMRPAPDKSWIEMEPGS